MRLLFAILALLASMFVTACGGKKPPIVQPTVVREVVTQEVKIPVPVKAQPPAELLTPILAPLPVFVPPTHPEASSALTAEGERLLRALLEDVLSRLAAWKAWATTKAD